MKIMSIRTEKVAEEIKHQISEVLSRDMAGFVIEAGLGLVTVTRVIVSKNLKNTKIYLSFIGNRNSSEVCVEKMNFRVKQIRMHLAHRIRLKFTPEIMFYYDDTIEYASRIDELIKEIHKGENDK
jgi:ribosome-binding factor A